MSQLALEFSPNEITLSAGMELVEVIGGTTVVVDSWHDGGLEKMPVVFLVGRPPMFLKDLILKQQTP